MKNIGTIIYIFILFFVGIMCLFYPETIQKIAINMVSQGYLPQNGHLEVLIKSTRYLIVVRAVGIGFILMCSVVTWVLFNGAQTNIRW